MSFSYEEVGNENLELLKSLCFKDWSEKPIICYAGREWCIDRSIPAYFTPIGSFRGETPDYADLCYKGRMVRMETSEGKTASNSIIYKINKISIPKSIWDSKDDILRIIVEASKVYILGNIIHKNCNVEVIIAAEPEEVEVDYNGR